MDVNDRVEGFLNEYQQHRDSLTELMRKMRDISVTATSPRREVAVTVGQTGTLIDIRFPTSAHKRLTRNDLTTLIMETFAEAKEQAAEQAATILAPAMPDGMDVQSLVRGTAEADTFLPPEPRMPGSVQQALGLGRPAK